MYVSWTVISVSGWVSKWVSQSGVCLFPALISPGIHHQGRTDSLRKLYDKAEVIYWWMKHAVDTGNTGNLPQELCSISAVNVARKCPNHICLLFKCTRMAEPYCVIFSLPADKPRMKFRLLIVYGTKDIYIITRESVYISEDGKLWIYINM